ncbi:hypothetical protein R2R35_14035 [Anaerocolumna sp. AGMB13020]|nr:hypothetical protein [Anaerocolumna sp. AGMB13020]WOO34917.1 hypothetical protein R2R35_14035 [Anaerocolumna sp. AGMB13020]
MVKRSVDITVHTTDITKLEIALNEAERILETHPNARIDIEVAEN